MIVEMVEVCNLDGNTTTERFPSHRYTSDGAYRVCLTVSNDNSADVSCDTLFLGVTSLEETTEPRNNPICSILSYFCASNINF